ncbi:MAG TPA: sugar phosphate nucleotidyltransferase [Candidatus Pacearchaeota archaeon]|mgnify:FL=1|nr:sugar phosphate nucleotidyltransferase [Candidatus Pacearchaeota archaeon]
MIKKVVIAAAGQGTRMLHITKNKSKHLIKVGKKPFLSYLLDNLIEAGFDEIILVVGYKEEKMREFVKEFNYKVNIVNQFEILGPKEKIYGTACPLMCVRDILKNEQFLFVCGDNFYSVRDLKEMRNDKKYNYIAAIRHAHPEKYGVLINENGFLKEIVEKPKEKVGDLINAGLYKFTPEVFDKLSEIKKSSRGEYEITDAITLLAKEKKVKIKVLQDYWLDFGNPSDILMFSKFIKEKK